MLSSPSGAGDKVDPAELNPELGGHHLCHFHDRGGVLDEAVPCPPGDVGQLRSPAQRFSYDPGTLEGDGQVGGPAW